ncbi:hypothetical protein A3770_19p82930 [Chloropicon primus]|uniref:Glycosyl transferase family 25 domain-containing protein n=1 Tax=Chloropicon primus TaxID=1764295 RepID=A0A5B8N1L9_9CHLO|nr:hypothetical protein A3770_19p82930 [Chloropicon primus]|eukprot:QDZ25775.1 hypothetical protein A3770_19p82930 [Chloropicon primus]
MRGTRTPKAFLGACFLCVILSLPLVLWGVHGAGHAGEERGKGKGNNGDEEVWPSRSLRTGPGVALSAQPAVDEEAYGGEGSRQRIASRSPQRGGLDIYWINLDESVERRASMETMLKSAAASFPTVRSTRVPGIDAEAVRDMLRLGRVELKEGLAAAPPGAEEETRELNLRNEYTEGQFACALSHLTAIKRAYDDNSELALILEDDVSVPASFLETWESYAAMAPQDWTVLQWYTSNPVVVNASLNYQDPWISWMPEHWSTAAYMVNREGMERILRGVQSDASADWYFGDDMVIADELLYALAGRTYTATRTLGVQHDYGVDSTVESADVNNKITALLQASNVDMARITPRKECILVLTNCLIKAEEQLNDEIATLESDMQALSQWNPCSKWKVNFVVRTNLKLAFAEKLRGLVEQGHLEPLVRYTSSSAAFNKYAFMKPLVRQMEDYDYVLVKDADQRIAGFPWNSFMEKKGESVISGPLRQVVGESVMNWTRTWHSNRQKFQLHEAKYWKSAENATDFESVEPLASGFIEQYFVLLEGDFAAWFFKVALTDGFLNQTLSWAPDNMWCGAAADMHPEKPACALVPVVSEHLDTRQIEKEDKEGRDISIWF